MDPNDCELDCTLSIENITNTGHVTKSQKIQSCTIALGRDQFKDIVVKVSSSRSEKQQDIVMKNVKLFKKFLREGKATVRTQDKIQLLISNCPPDRLAMFLKVLSIKVGIRKNHATDKTRLYSSLTKEFQFISPLTDKDCSTFQEITQPAKSQMPTKQKGTSRSHFTDITPKRKRVEDVMSLPRKRINSSENFKHSSTSRPALAERKKSSKLTAEQNEILQAVMRGRNVFFTGSAGTGKSFLLKRILGALPPESTVAAASTGIAACHIGGITLHSFAGT